MGNVESKTASSGSVLGENTLSVNGIWAAFIKWVKVDIFNKIKSSYYYMRMNPNLAIYISVGLTLLPYLIEYIYAVWYVSIQFAVCGAGYVESDPQVIDFIDLSFLTAKTEEDEKLWCENTVNGNVTFNNIPFSFKHNAACDEFYTNPVSYDFANNVNLPYLYISEVPDVAACDAKCIELGDWCKEFWFVNAATQPTMDPLAVPSCILTNG